MPNSWNFLSYIFAKNEDALDRNAGNSAPHEGQSNGLLLDSDSIDSAIGYTDHPTFEQTAMASNALPPSAPHRTSGGPSNQASTSKISRSGNLNKPRRGALGLSLICESTEPTTSDIVFVHGLQGGSISTWTAANGQCWPRDFLPRSIKSARIFTFGYNADIFSRNDTGIEECAKSLLNALEVNRNRKNGAEKRPLVFIGHSMGGLVIKSALVEAKERNHAVWSAACDGGVMFMAVPHCGSKDAGWAEMLGNIAKVGDPSNTDLLKQLKQNSAFLLVLGQRFGNVQKSLELATVLEGERIPFGPRGTSKVVPDDSARLNLGEDEYIHLGSDHQTVCKFASFEDIQYKQVAYGIEKLTVSSRATTGLASM
ncbi:unnamed protein product [Periconia digitata]|uniref:DUF676 domain-containing protein n=1 Tax=Periconia digitata TaxID=1303443 RepID=A0A9W4UGF3_9PLEO|nr:unnamed protein product [Periconia digitata]